MPIAELLLSALLMQLVSKVSSGIGEVLNLSWGAKKQLQKLQRTLGIIQSLLQDAEGKQVAGDAVREWIGRLKEAAYDADDLLDELMSEGLQQKMEIQGLGKVRNFFSLKNPLVGARIKEIRGKLDEIENLGISYGLSRGIASSQLEVIPREETTSSFDESKIHGRSVDKESIVELLTATANQQNPSIIPIVGMGGLGKTTLAQLAFNDPRMVTEGHFELKRWVHSSYQLDVKSVIQKIMEYDTTGATFNISNLDVLEARLRQNLNGKKFLLVLDDVWTEDEKISKKLKILLSCGAQGSKVIITTRSEKVASLWTTDDPYRLKRLSDSDCWKIFKQQAIGVGREEDTNLEAIGREITKKCKGVPLAAEVLGGRLRMESDENVWLLVKKCELWQIPEQTNGIISELWLSYYYLKSHLKLCFAYCSLFNNCYNFDKDDLIQQWMAQGFLHPRGNNNDDFNYLVSNSLLKIGEKDDDGNAIGWYKMHDLISDLARFVAQDSYLNVEANRSEDVPITTRHLSLNLGATSTMPEPLCRENKSRTLLFWNNRKNIAVVPDNIFNGLSCLRVLDLSCTGIRTLPSSIDKLKHLRYLNLSETNIQKLPESLRKLLHLQTLKLSGCSNLRELPKSLSKMVSLRHLYTDGCNSLAHIPTEITKLSSLQILSMFVVSEEGGCGIGGLKSLNLRGELSIEKLKNLKTATEAKEAHLKEKCHLHKLKLSWDHDGEANSTERAEQVMKGLEPHHTLKRLHVEGYCGAKFPSWMMKLSLPKLVEISLENCINCQQLPPLGKLRYLKILIVKKMYVVQYVDGMQGGSVFPSLEELTFEEMHNLEKWWGVEGAQVELPRLAKLTIKDCPKLMTLPNSLCLKRLELFMSNINAINSVANFKSLSFLKIDDVSQDLRCLPIGDLPSLHTLVVSNCPNLTLLQLQNLNPLKVIHIESCSGLFSIENLNYLEELVLSECEKLTRHCLTEEETEGALIRSLTRLKNLCIKGSRNIRSLPEGIQHLTALESLEIGFCPNLESLPEGLQRMTTLQSLLIEGCYKLASLPECLGDLISLRCLMIKECPHIMSLPTGLQRLTTLQELRIIKCQHLKTRYVKGGDDWEKISHVATIYID